MAHSSQTLVIPGETEAAVVVADEDAVALKGGIGPEDIERNGYDGQYVRAPKSPGWVRLEGGWFEVKRPADAERFMMGAVSDRAAPLKQAQRERWDASMAAANARGKLIQMQRVALRYRVPFVEPEDTRGDAPAEESLALLKRFEADREALITDIKAALRRRTWRLRAWLATILAVIGLSVWAVVAVAAQLAPPIPGYDRAAGVNQANPQRKPNDPD